MLLKLVDGGIENIYTDEEHYPGCPTCDYGSQYINDVEVTLTKHIIRASFNTMYGYLLSSGDLMQMILTNVDAIQKMTESEFIKWLRLAFYQKANEAGRLDETEMDFEVSDKTNKNDDDEDFIIGA